MNQQMKHLLLTPLTYKQQTFNNRIVMAPMSRRRAEGAMPQESMGIYYAQRAGAGLIIAENTAVSPNGVGYLNIPGIFNDAQQAAWKKITGQVHARGGKIFLQLVHTGRIGHPANQWQQPVVGASALPAAGVLRTPYDAQAPFPVPHALTTQEADGLVAAHVQAAERAIAAGFDGVEVHGAHGFLPMQFLHPLTNNRTDKYGGTIENRSRFLLDILKGIMDAIGPERTGLRLSPFSGLNDLPPFPEELATYRYIVEELRKTSLLYIHLSDQSTNGEPPIPHWYLQELRERFPNLIILAGGYTQATATAMLEAGLADLIAFGRTFISNPDLPERFRHGWPLAPADEATFYHGGDHGLIDYPSYSRPRECAHAAG